MRLALIRQNYNPFGGAERFVESALPALRAHGMGVTLIARAWPQTGIRGDRELIRCDPFHIGRLWRDVSFARRAMSIVHNEQFDLVQSHERIAGCDVYRAGDGVHATWLEIRRRAQNPLERLGQSLHPWHRYVLRTEAKMFADPRLRAVVCNSEMVRMDIATRFDVADGKLHVIYSGVDLDRFHPRLRREHHASIRVDLGIESTAPLMLYVGSGFARKGVSTLLDAFARVPRKDLHLLVVGRDRLQRRFAARAARLGLANRVRFLGGKPDVRPYYGAADAFVLPTLYDPFPNAALEALACGLPVATSSTCGAAELIVGGCNGFVCEALDVDALAHNLERLCSPGVAASMRDAARASVADLSLEAMAARLVSLYGSLLGGPQN